MKKNTLFIILSFLTATWAAWWFFRSLKLEPIYAGIAAIMFAFLPYHLLRINVGHLFLASYFVVPLSLLVALQLASDQPPDISRPKAWGSLFRLPKIVVRHWIMCCFMAVQVLVKLHFPTSLPMRWRPGLKLLQGLLSSVRVILPQSLPVFRKGMCSLSMKSTA